MDIDGSPALPMPPWADADLSQRLSHLAASGERQDLEYKERFPAQARDLAKEIAAFATSNSGTILLGVAKSGEIVGLADCETASGRESLLDRIAGICAKTVTPSITPRFRSPGSRAASSSPSTFRRAMRRFTTLEASPTYGTSPHHVLPSRRRSSTMS
jgi:Putative DNA-binding domain